MNVAKFITMFFKLLSLVQLTRKKTLLIERVSKGFLKAS